MARNANASPELIAFVSAKKIPRTNFFLSLFQTINLYNHILLILRYFLLPRQLRERLSFISLLIPNTSIANLRLYRFSNATMPVSAGKISCSLFVLWHIFMKTMKFSTCHHLQAIEQPPLYYHTCEPSCNRFAVLSSCPAPFKTTILSVATVCSRLRYLGWSARPPLSQWS